MVSVPPANARSSGERAIGAAWLVARWLASARAAVPVQQPADMSPPLANIYLNTLTRLLKK